MKKREMISIVTVAVLALGIAGTSVWYGITKETAKTNENKLDVTEETGQTYTPIYYKGMEVIQRIGVKEISQSACEN
jgi:hypothetical protein